MIYRPPTMIFHAQTVDTHVSHA